MIVINQITCLFAELLLDLTLDPRRAVTDRVNPQIRPEARPNRAVEKPPPREFRAALDPAAVDRRANLATPPGVTVETSHQDGSPMAELDRDQMIQVFVNLVGNAFDAMPDGGRLQILSRADAQWLIIEVKDSGIGIPKENLNKMFEPFFTTKPMGKGTGLGLPVVYGIVKLHRGDLTVESNPTPRRAPPARPSG